MEKIENIKKFNFITKIKVMNCKKMKILGVHIGHDASSSLIIDGKIIASAAEERFVRIKHYGGMPLKAAAYCLKEGGLAPKDIDIIAYSGHLGDRRLNTMFRLGSSTLSKIKGGGTSFKRLIKEQMKSFMSVSGDPPLYFESITLGSSTDIHYIPHHKSHAASAYYTSGNSEKTLVITSDGAGEDGNSMTIWLAEDGKMKLLKEYSTEYSYGHFYSAVTEALGWWVGDGEGTVMGLAPYGEIDTVPEGELSWLMPKFEAGEFVAPIEFGHISATEYQDTYHWHFKVSERIGVVVDKYGKEAVAARLQDMLEKEMIHFISYWQKETESAYGVTAGGVFLNVKLNQKIIEAGIFKDYYIFPDAGDTGISAGAALAICAEKGGSFNSERIKNVNWGPSYSNEVIKAILDERSLSYSRSDDIGKEIAIELANGKIVGWFQGRMECGPRALGGRSILYDARQAENKDIVNRTVKFRESFRPFCPSMKVESASKYLENSERIERYMISSYTVKTGMRDEIAAVTHVDGTCRPQMIERGVYPKFWNLLNEYEKLTGSPVLMNTSLNVKGEPIVCNPHDAIKCFYDTGIQVLVLGSYILRKS